MTNSTFGQKLAKDWKRNWTLYLLAIPIIAYYIVFHYVPMYGITIAFKDFTPTKGIWGSPWVGLKHFKDFFSSYYFARILKNTVIISLYGIIFSFPAPLILALLLNEVRSRWFKTAVQTLTYLPHFISLVVVCGMIVDFTSTNGIVNDIIAFFGGERTPLLQNAGLFRPIYIITNIWQEVGWGAIVYLAALSGVDPSLYEAARMDGAGRWKQLIHITIPSILPTIVILFILKIGSMMNVGSEKIILLYNPLTYETADVISTFVYRRGIQEFSYSFSTAVGLFNSVVNILLLVLANKTSRKVSETSLW